MQKKNQKKNIHKKAILDRILIACSPATTPEMGLVDGVYSYQTSYGFASGQIPRRSQGILLPISVRTQGIESVEQCATQGFNLVKQGKLSFEEPSCI
jgi:hypothetical protein